MLNYRRAICRKLLRRWYRHYNIFYSISAKYYSFWTNLWMGWSWGRVSQNLYILSFPMNKLSNCHGRLALNSHKKNIDHIKLAGYLPVSYPATSPLSIRYIQSISHVCWLKLIFSREYFRSRRAGFQGMTFWATNTLYNYIQTIQMSYVCKRFSFLSWRLTNYKLYLYIAFTAAYYTVSAFLRDSSSVEANHSIHIMYS